MSHTSRPLMAIGEMVDELNRHALPITHSSLRFLEREGLVSPKRTEGGHRLYTSDDVERVMRIKTWQAQRLTLEEIKERLNALPVATDLQENVTRRLVGGDFDAATDLMLRADESGVPLVDLYDNVLTPALAAVGDGWEAGSLQVSQEKEASECVRQIVALLTARHRSSRGDGKTAVAACVQDERHEFGLRMISGLLMERGWQVHVLGPDVAPCFLTEAIARHTPDLVLLSATIHQRLPAVEAAIASALEAAPEACVVVGGWAIRGHEARIRSLGAIPAEPALAGSLSVISDAP